MVPGDNGRLPGWLVAACFWGGFVARLTAGIAPVASSLQVVRREYWSPFASCLDAASILAVSTPVKWCGRVCWLSRLGGYSTAGMRALDGDELRDTSVG